MDILRIRILISGLHMTVTLNTVLHRILVMHIFLYVKSKHSPNWTTPAGIIPGNKDQRILIPKIQTRWTPLLCSMKRNDAT